MFRRSEGTTIFSGQMIAAVVVASVVLTACGGGGDEFEDTGDAATASSTSNGDVSSTTAVELPSRPVPATAPTTATTDDVRRDWTNDAVRVWQQFLADGGAVIDIDGFFGPQSETATKAFQAKLGIPQTGVADPVTLAAAGPAVRQAVFDKMTIITTTTTTERVPLPDDPVVSITCPGTETETQAQYRAVFTHTESYKEFGSISIDYGDGDDFGSRLEDSGLTGAFWHVYDKPGTFEVEVIIKDEDGREAIATCTHTWSPGQ